MIINFSSISVGVNSMNSLETKEFRPENWTQSDLKFCKNDGSKRSKINEKGGQLDQKSWRKLIQNA